MDYVVGSVAALVTGNVTPSRPRMLKRALTPTKHQPSPNVTPKSEFVDDRSIFLSPSVQKKKAIVKKSPKRIFQNPDLETTANGEENLSLTSPKADKVKKHLEDELDSDMGSNKNAAEAKSIKLKEKNKKESAADAEESNDSVNVQTSNENTPKKKKKKNKTVSENAETPSTEVTESVITEVSVSVPKSPKKMKQRRQSVFNDDSNKENAVNEIETEPKLAVDETSPTKQKKKSESTDNIVESKNVEVSEVANDVNTKKKKNKKRKKKAKQTAVEETESTEDITVKPGDIKKDENNQNNKKKKNRKRKKSQSQQNKTEVTDIEQSKLEDKNDDVDDELTVPTKKSKTVVNPNAITDKESDSEHESDNEIESENEEINKKVFAEEPKDEDSSDEGEEKTKEVEQKQKAENKENKSKGEVNTEDEVKRTLFVGNVPFSAKCKKEIKKIFNKHGQIETIRIRTVPIKDGRYTPKLAVIKNELHPERTTVNVYIRYADEESLEKALAENNTVLNDHHLRVSRSSSTGAEHDPKCSIFLGNLPFAIEDETLREKFAKCGEIESVRIIRDKKTNAGKGFGYVNFASKDGVELALALTEEDLTIKNRIIRVKRCTQLTNKQKQKPNQRQHSAQRQTQGNQRGQTSQRQNHGNQRVQPDQRQNQGYQRGQNQGYQRSQSGQRQNQGNQRSQSGQRQNQGYQGSQSGQRQNQGYQRGQSGQRQNQGNQRWNQGFQRDNQGGQRQEVTGQDGAHRRIMHKRKSQDASGGDGPPNKIQKEINEPNKEKKTRKEFVGMTAEKKKKRKFDKGQKKKKALSEILTK